MACKTSNVVPLDGPFAGTCTDTASKPTDSTRDGSATATGVVVVVVLPMAGMGDALTGRLRR